jgi:hypothetical protein
MQATAGLLVGQERQSVRRSGWTQATAASLVGHKRRDGAASLVGRKRREAVGCTQVAYKAVA